MSLPRRMALLGFTHLGTDSPGSGLPNRWPPGQPIHQNRKCRMPEGLLDPTERPSDWMCEHVAVRMKRTGACGCTRMSDSPKSPLNNCASRERKKWIT